MENLDWYMRGRQKRENSRIYSAQFFNNPKDFGVVAASCKRNEMRVFETDGVESKITLNLNRPL